MLKANKGLALIALGILIALIYITAFLLTVISLFEKSNIKYYNFIKIIMRYLLPTISLSFFGQIFESLILIYLCDEKEISDKYNSFECPNKAAKYLFSVLCAFGIFFFINISFITVSIFYKPSFIPDKNNSLTKMGSSSNIIFLFNKIIFIVLTNINTTSKLYTWFMLIVLLVSTFANMIGFTKFNNYENKILKEINKFFSILLFSFISFLIISSIFNGLGFNGTIYFFLFGILISIISAILYKESLNAFSYIDFKVLSSTHEQILYIKKLLYLIKYKHLYREKTLTFDSLVLFNEENCINKNCKLKKYLKSVEKGEPNDFLLFQHCQRLYEIALKKSDDIILKINYVVYLIVQMSKRKLAEKVFYTIKPQLFHLEANFLIYCCNKFIESFNNKSDNIFVEDNKNFMKRIEYDRLNDEFKNDLIHASSLFYEFWNMLNNYYNQGVKNFYKLKNIGKELTILINTIEEKFQMLINIQGENTNLLFLYSEFSQCILNDSNKYDNLKNILESSSKIDKIKDFEVDYTNFDFKFLKGSDEYKYMIISAEEENLGTILNISNNSAKIFGYSQQELIGKKFSSLLPYISQKEFDDYLVKNMNNSKMKFYETLSNQKEYLPQIDELFINAKSKSKYLIQIYVKMMFVQTEESNHAYILTISYLEDINLNKLNDIFQRGILFNLKKKKEEELYKYCIILTDMNFMIQTFTSNCQEHLGLNRNIMNSNVDLTQFISEFNERVDELEKREKLTEKPENFVVHLFEGMHHVKKRISTGMTNIIDIEMSPEKKIAYKRYIAQNNYSESKLITWKTNTFDNYVTTHKSACKGEYTNPKIMNNNLYLGINEKNSNEKMFLLVIKKAEFNNKQFGYIFFFHREEFKCIEKKDNIYKSSIDDINSLLNVENKKELVLPKQVSVNFKSSLGDKEENKTKDNNNDNTMLEIKYSKTQKKIIKMPKSLDSEVIQKQNQGNIVGIIESKIKNILSDELYKKNSPIKKCSFKNSSSHLSLYGKENEKGDNEENSEIFSKQKFFESVLRSMNYVPKCNFNFSLDLKLMSFRPSYSLFKEMNLTEILKTEAEKKMNLTKNLKDKKELIKDSSYDSSLEINESIESEEYSSSKTSFHSGKKSPKKTSEKMKRGVTTKKDINKEYYRVSGLNKIKLMVFDFDQEMVIEKETKEEFKSEVENVLNNFKLDIPILISKDHNDPTARINKFIRKYSNENTRERLIRMDSSQIKNPQAIKKQKELCNKIKTKLNRKEKSITAYILVCFLFILIILGIGGVSLYFILSDLESFKGYLSLIVYAALLRHYTDLGVHHLRMYTLTKINITSETDGTYLYYIYGDTEKNRTKYIKDLYDELQKDFFKGADYLEKVIAIDIKINKNNQDKLYSKSFNNILFGDKLTTRNVSTSYMVGLSQIYSHFYYLIANIQNLEYNAPEIQNFIINALNNGDSGLKEIIDIFIDEITRAKNNHIKISYILISIYFLVLFLMFFPVKRNYSKILLKRDRYISTFYQINISFIKTSILKCKQFLNFINPHESIMNDRKKKGKLNKTIGISNCDDNLISEEQMKNNIDKENIQNLTEKENEKMEDQKSVMIVFIGFLLIIFLYMLIILLEFNKYITKFEIMALYMDHMLHYHNNIINSYNAYNEYLFNNESKVENIPALDFIYKAIDDTFDTLTADLSYLGSNSTEIPGLYEVYVKVQQEQLCKNTKCDPYIESITSLGFFSFVAFMTVEMRVKVNFIKFLLNTSLLPDNPDEKRLVLFNNIHHDVDLMFSFVAIHYIENEITLSLEKILENINSRNNYYIAIYAVFFVFIIVVYLVYWNPFVQETQNQIFNAKEALNIIPIEILESQTNIKSLLGISDLS